MPCVGIDLTLLAGSLEGWTLRAEWRVGGIWVAGTSFSDPAVPAPSPGRLIQEWQCANVAGRWQNRAAVWIRPAGTADAVRVILARAASASGSQLRIDLLNIRTASEAEVKALLANGYADAQIASFSATIIGPGGAIATSMETLRVEFGEADALIRDSVVTVANDVEALAGRTTTLEATFGGNNLVRNPVFSDGVRSVGSVPDWWDNWGPAFSVIARGGSIAAVANAPTPYIARLTDGVMREARAHKAVPVKPGQLVATGFQASASGPPLSVVLEARVRWLAADAVTLLGTGVRSVTLTGVNWITTDFEPVEAPDAAAFFDFWIRQAGRRHDRAGLLYAGREPHRRRRGLCQGGDRRGGGDDRNERYRHHHRNGDGELRIVGRLRQREHDGGGDGRQGGQRLRRARHCRRRLRWVPAGGMGR